jgi:Domain of unknown function (DUF4410)
MLGKTGVYRRWNISFRASACMTLGLCLASCASARIVSSATSPLAVENRPPAVVYVSDFALQAEDVKSEGGVLSGRDHRTLLGSALPYSPLMLSASKADKAKHLATLMSRSVASDLKERGFDVRSLAPGSERPPSGWLIEGQFLDVDEGDRAKRALIGFGSGHTNLEVKVEVIDLAAGAASPPILDVTTEARSGKTPGAVVGLNPYAAAGGLVLGGLDSDTDVKNSASKISDEIVRRLLPAQQAARTVPPLTEALDN